MTDFPRSLIEFQRRFGDEAACAQYLAAARWPDGFVCPGCGGGKAWRLQTKAWTYECASCGRQTSVTAGTIMHHSKLPLTAWFWAAYLMATHSNGDPVTGGGRSHQGKLLVVGAVEVEDGSLGPGRVRLSQVPDYSAASLHAFLAANLAPGATAKTDGCPDIPAQPASPTTPMSSARWLPTSSCPWVHRIFANLKVWALGVYHGLRRKYLQSYLDEFVFRFNRRRTRHAASDPSSASPLRCSPVPTRC